MAMVLFSKEHGKHPHSKWLNSFIRSNRRGGNKDIRITYKKDDGEISHRKIRPLYAKKDVLVAHDHGKNAYRSFKLERIQNMEKTAFICGFEKRAGEVAIPKGGLKPGFLYNDITQVMTPEDAKKAKEQLARHKRTGPGYGVTGALGSLIGGLTVPSLISNIKDEGGLAASGKGAIIGAAVGAGLPYLLTRFGAYDKQALNAAKEINSKLDRRS